MSPPGAQNDSGRQSAPSGNPRSRFYRVILHTRAWRQFLPTRARALHRMRRVSPTWLLAAVLVYPAEGQETRDPTAAGIAYRVPGMDSVTVDRNIVYKTVIQASDTPRTLALGVYRSRGLPQEVRRPALILVHGGIIPGQGPMPKE